MNLGFSWGSTSSDWFGNGTLESKHKYGSCGGNLEAAHHTSHNLWTSCSLVNIIGPRPASGKRDRRSCDARVPGKHDRRSCAGWLRRGRHRDICRASATDGTAMPCTRKARPQELHCEVPRKCDRRSCNARCLESATDEIAARSASKHD